MFKIFKCKFSFKVYQQNFLWVKILTIIENKFCHGLWRNCKHPVQKGRAFVSQTGVFIALFPMQMRLKNAPSALFAQLIFTKHCTALTCICRKRRPATARRNNEDSIRSIALLTYCSRTAMLKGKEARNGKGGTKGKTNKQYTYLQLLLHNAFTESSPSLSDREKDGRYECLEW